MFSFKNALLGCLVFTAGAVIMVALLSFASWQNFFADISWGLIRYVAGVWVLAFAFAATCKLYELIKSRQQKVKS
ncbi:hypothetical protein V2154_13355 [Ewingella sp. CoE-038-23]|uniref:hypothetical protein n=1 Tax=Ewingella docleensis TaxID=3118588 RepID=UPI0033655534